MKKLIVLFAAIVLVSGLTSTVKAQVAATATGSATIITPISIVNAGNMNFGNIAVKSSAGGTVILATDGSRTTGGAGGVTLPQAKGTVSTASFTVNGLAASTYAITLPTTDYTISDGSNHTMIVNGFTSNPSGTGTLSSGGAQTINVGATLNVGAGQVANTYTNSTTPFSVTVNYN
jgi:hypothetical protein